MSSNRVVQRLQEIRELHHYIQSRWPLIFVYGQKGSGKTRVVRQVVDETSLKYSWIDLIQMLSPNEFYSEIMSDLKTESDQTLNLLQLNEFKCESPADFVSHFKTFKPNTKTGIKEQMIIILDSVQSLLQMDTSFCNLMSRLPEFIKDHVDLSIIFISNLPLHHFRRQSSYMPSPVVLFFRTYTKEEMFEILKVIPPLDGYSQEFFENYLNLTLSCVHQVTRNLSDIKFILENNFEKYVEPIENKQVSKTEPQKLWRHFEPHLKKSLANIGLKGIRDLNTMDEIPFSSKFLIIAAYLASYNSKSTDKRFFLRNQGKQRKVHTLNREEKTCNGPKSFSLERLIHIYDALLRLNYDYDDEDGAKESITTSKMLRDPSVEVLSQIQNLVSLKLVSRLNSGVSSSLSSTKKWRISESVTYEFMTRVASSVNFDLKAHLEQFSHKK